MTHLYLRERLRRAALALTDQQNRQPVDVVKLYVARARMERARKAFRCFVRRAANPNSLPACDYCGYTTHDDTPCPSRVQDAKRFKQPDRKP